MVTARAPKAIGPLALDEISKAITLGAKPPSKLSGGHGCVHGLPPLWGTNGPIIIQRKYQKFQ